MSQGSSVVDSGTCCQGWYGLTVSQKPIAPIKTIAEIFEDSLKDIMRIDLSTRGAMLITVSSLVALRDPAATMSIFKIFFYYPPVGESQGLTTKLIGGWLPGVKDRRIDSQLAVVKRRPVT